jgi:hypothetical protein
MKTCIVVLCKGLESSQWMINAKLFLEERFSEEKVDYLFVDSTPLQENRVHPAWYKLLVHKHTNYKYDYIICWDLDLLPTKKNSIQTVLSDIDPEKFYLCIDTDLVSKNINNSSFIENDACSNFRWNTGLMGIPKAYSKVFETIHENNSHSTRNSWEQYYVNDYLYNNLDLVKEGNWNNNVIIGCLGGWTVPNPFKEFESAINIHYSIFPPNHFFRAEKIKLHIDSFDAQ